MSSNSSSHQSVLSSSSAEAIFKEVQDGVLKHFMEQSKPFPTLDA